MKKMSLLIRVLLAASIFLITQQTIAGTLLVSHVLSNTLAFHDENTLDLLQEINVGTNPHEIVLTRDGQYALISNFGDVNGHLPGDTITVVDVAAATVEKVIKLPIAARPHGFAMLSDTTTLVTAQGIQSLLLIDFKQGEILKTLPLPGAGAHMLVVDSNQDFAYIANSESGSVVKVNLRQLKVVGEVKVGNEIMGIALTPNGLLLAADRKGDKVVVLRAFDFTILKSISTQCQPVRVELFDNGKSAVVANSISGSAQIIDLDTLAIIKTFKTSAARFSEIPINVFVTNDQRTAYISHYSGEVSYIDLIEGRIIISIKSGITADGVALSDINSLKSFNQSDTVFSSGPVEINASIDTVWHISKDINNYNHLSNGAITAYIDGPIAPGKIIEFQLYKDDPIGKIIPTSYETVTIVDENLKILNWVRKLPDGQYTSRYQFLQRLPDNKTLSYIVLHIPGAIGKTTQKVLGKSIDQAFQLLHEGIKREAESTINQ